MANPGQCRPAACARVVYAVERRGHVWEVERVDGLALHPGNVNAHSANGTNEGYRATQLMGINFNALADSKDEEASLRC